MVATVEKKSIEEILGDTHFLYYKDKVLEHFKEYKWKPSLVKKHEQEIFGGALMHISFGVAKYGIEATLPGGSSGKSKAELEALERLEKKKLKRYLRMKGQVMITERYIDLIPESEETDDLYAIVSFLLAGMSHASIKGKLGFNNTKYTKRLELAIAHILQDEITMKFITTGVVELAK